jgi:hypothetical protein
MPAEESVLIPSGSPEDVEEDSRPHSPISSRRTEKEPDDAASIPCQ